MWVSIKRFMVNDDGPAAVEYAVMLALILIVCIVSIKAVGNNAKESFNIISDNIDGTIP